MNPNPVPPPLAYPLEAPLADLTTPELLLVTTVRLLVLGDRAGPGRDWRGGLRAAGASREAEGALEALFEIVASTQRRRLDLRCPCRKRLGEDEGLLLQAIGLLQHGRAAPAEALLGQWLPPAALRVAMGPARTLARALAEARVVIPRRPDDGALRRGRPVYCDPGLHRLQ